MSPVGLKCVKVGELGRALSLGVQNGVGWPETHQKLRHASLKKLPVLKGLIKRDSGGKVPKLGTVEGEF